MHRPRAKAPMLSPPCACAPQCVSASSWQNCRATQVCLPSPATALRGIYSRALRAQHALDECVEAGERRRFRVDSSCRRWRRIYQSCGLHGDLDCSRQLEWLRDCIRTTLQEEMAKPKVLAAEPPREL